MTTDRKIRRKQIVQEYISFSDEIEITQKQLDNIEKVLDGLKTKKENLQKEVEDMVGRNIQEAAFGVNDKVVVVRWVEQGRNQVEILKLEDASG